MAATQVVIVGGGIIGCSIAYHLTEAGVRDVLLIERGTLAGGVTGICPGGIRQQFESEADCRLAQRSVRFYERINDILEPEAPFYFERSGYLFLAYSMETLNRYRRNVRMQNGLGIPSRILDSSEIHDMLPGLTCDGLFGGSYCAEDGFLEDCHGVTNHFAERARRAGAELRREEVLSLTPEGGGWRVTTDASQIETKEVVLAAGADSVSLAASTGIALPIVAERRRLAYTAPCEGGILRPLVVAFERGFAGKQLTNGVLYLGWLRESADADDFTFIEQTMAVGSTVLPILSEVAVRRVMGGIYDNTPDRRPLLGPVNGVDGFFLATGFSGRGFMIAPAVGEMVAASITGRKTDLPLEEFSLDRFSRASSREALQI
jgi:sarcosine oxidase subunit beta